MKADDLTREATMTKAKQMTLEERIAAMKAAVEDRKRRQAEEKQRAERKAGAETSVLSSLTSLLWSLNGLPVTAQGVDGHVDVDQSSAVTVRCVSWDDVREMKRYEDLIVFTCASDHDGSRAWLLHDGDEVTLDVAADLAVAAVEARFAG